MQKQKLKNKHFTSFFTPFYRAWNFILLLLLVGFTQPVFGQDVNPCGSIQVVGTTESSSGGGAVFQGIVVSNPITDNQAVRIFNKNWEQVAECRSEDCGNPYTFATSAGKYFVQVQLFSENDTWICQNDPIEVTVSETNQPIDCEGSNFCNQDITLSSQAEVDAFCGCEEINGDLKIIQENDAITTLLPLRGLQKITGDLVISGTDLVDLIGLEDLHTIETAFFLGQNPALESLTGLSGLTTVRTTFFIHSNPVMKNLDGAFNLTNIGNISIETNESLTKINAFHAVAATKSLRVNGNHNLVSLEGLSGLTTVGSPNQGGISFNIAGNRSLTSLAPLANVKQVYNDLVVNFNAKLGECCALAPLLDNDPNNGQAHNDVTINDNAAGCNSVAEILENCQGTLPDCNAITISGEEGKITIDKLNAPIEIVKIYDENWNRIFECSADCDDPTVYETTAGKYYVQIQFYTADWEWICGTDNIEVTVEEDINCGNGSYCQQEIIFLTNQAEVDAFCDCETLEGNLIIGNVDSPEITDITNLHALKALKYTTGEILIFRTGIHDLEGLDNLEYIGRSLVLDSNPNLKNFSKLNKLHTIEQALALFSNVALTSLEGLKINKLSSFATSNNPELADITALSEFTHLNALNILGPQKLTNLAALSNLTSLGNGEDNFALSITGTNLLSTLDALSNLTTIDGMVKINQNVLLTDCCGIAHLIDEDTNNGSITGEISFDNNPEGCNSIEEILENCINQPPSCADLVTTISDLIIENGQARREVTITFNTPDGQRTGINLFDRNLDPNNGGLLFDCGICEDNKNFTLEEGEYVLSIDRSYLDLTISNRGCSEFYFIDVPAEPCTDNDGDYLCDFNECNDNDATVIDLKFPAGTPCNDEDAATENDVVQEDGCTCAGTPISDNLCENIQLSLNPNAAGTIDIAGLTTPHYIVKVYDEHWNQLLSCTDDCTFVGAYDSGLYRIHVQLYDVNWQYICETDFLEITIGGNNNCGDYCSQAEIRLNNQAEVDAFCGCEIITGDLIIGNVDNQDLTDITSLKPLEGLKSIGGTLYIYRTKLEGFDGLNELTTIEASFLISGNPDITNMEGLENINTINGSLNISDNFALTSLDGLNLANLIRFSSTNNPELANLNALNTLTHLDGLEMAGPHKLTDLSGLENLTSLGVGQPIGYALIIAGTNNLVNLDALSNLESCDGMLRLTQNMALTNCCGISHLIDGDAANGEVTGTIRLESNPEGCNSVEEIVAKCSDQPQNCEDIVTVISDLIIENGKASREVSVTQNTPGHLVTTITFLDRGPFGSGVLYSCGTDCEPETKITLEEGEYVLHISRFNPGQAQTGEGCDQFIFIDVNPNCEDNDNDYICAQNDCDDNNPDIGLKLSVGGSCNDGNPATQNDVIQADSCTCLGTPIFDNPCDNISLSLSQYGNNAIQVNGKFGDKEIIKVYDDRWNIVRDCATIPDYEEGCNTFGPFEPGLYRVYVQQYTEDWQYICETDFLEIEIPAVANGSRNREDFINEKGIILFPNPVLNTLNIKTKILKDKKASIQIFNTFGQLIETLPEKVIKDNYEAIEVGHYENGLYLMTIQVDNRRVISKRFLVENLK